MSCRCWLAIPLALCLVASPTAAETLSIQRAIELALAANPDLAAVHVAEAEARAQQEAVSRAWLPHVNLDEGWQRGNQPVFAFGSLLAQRRFTEADFAVQSLNNPTPLSNYRGAVVLRESIFDAGDARARAATATATTALASAAYRQTTLDTAAAVAQAYGNAIVADADARAAAAAIEAATHDIARAEARRDAGMATSADVLSLKVHLAEMQAREIAARGDGRIARATLNRLIGASLDADWEIVQPAIPTANTADALDARVTNRPDVVQAALRVDVADGLARAARAARFPRVDFEGGYEWNGDRWAERAPSWLVGIRAQLSFSASGAEAARSRAAAYAVERARLERAGTELDARLDIRTAVARVETAHARQEVAMGAVRQARESQRIIRDRYNVGLAGVSEVLRAADATLTAESLQVNADVEAMVASVMLDRAVGRTPQLEP